MINEFELCPKLHFLNIIVKKLLILVFLNVNKSTETFAFSKKGTRIKPDKNTTDWKKMD